MRYLAAIFALLLVWACASAVADEKRLSKMPREAPLGTKAPVGTKAPAKTKAPASIKTRVSTKAPAGTKTPVSTKGAPAGTATTPSPRQPQPTGAPATSAPRGTPPAPAGGGSPPAPAAGGIPTSPAPGGTPPATAPGGAAPPTAGAPPAPPAGSTPPAPPPTVTRLPLAAADMIAADGRSVGTVVLTQTPEGVRLALALRDLPPGEHGFHLHAVGKCEPPSFTSAGAHFNPESKKHGFFARDGHHAGDMANILVPPGGALSTTLTNKRITLDRGKPNSVFQEGGTALIIHDKFDDYITDPIGNSGDRIACGVIK